MSGRRADQEGAVAVVTAIVLVILLALLAFVVDFGLVRADVRDSQSAADAAATAGVGKLTGGDTSYQAACIEAVDYLEANLGITLASTLCDPFAPGTTTGFVTPSITCGARGASTDPPTTDVMVVAPVYVETTVGDYTIRIQMPVRDSDTQMAGQAIDAGFDGVDPCTRMGVSVRRARDAVFGSFAGDGGGQSGFADAVARSFESGSIDLIASLVVLDRDGCSTLRANGTNAEIDVQSVTIGPDTFPGTITSDSAPSSCSNNDRTFDPDGGGARIHADGDIFSHGLAVATTPAATAAIYNPGDVPVKLDPAPRPGGLIRRQPIDHRYNCMAYVSGPAKYLPESTWLPAGFRQDGVEDCSGTTPYVKRLYDFVDGRSALSFGALGFRVFPLPGEACNNANVTAAPGVRRWYFNCPGGTTIRNGSTITIPRADLVVFAGGVDVNSGGTFRVNTDGTTVGPADGILAIWTGSLAVQGTIDVQKTLTYINEGRLNKTGGGGLRMNAPIGAAACDDSGLYPSGECFEDLAVWSNGPGTSPSEQFNLGGNGLLDVEGTVFVPNGKVNVAGASASDLRDAQFFGWRFEYSGNGVLTLIPNPDRATSTPIYGVALIR